MRTTVSIDDDVLEAARTIAAAEGSSTGSVLTRLARRGLRSSDRVVHGADDLPAFAVPEDASPMTIDTVARALED